jgi:hypothetical protein
MSSSAPNPVVELRARVVHGAAQRLALQLKIKALGPKLLLQPHQ